MAHFEKISLARWFWAFFKNLKSKKMFCLVKWAKTNDFSSIGKMKDDKTAKSLPTYRIPAFEVWLFGSNLLNFESENLIGWKRFGTFISPHLAYRRKSVCFCSFYEAKHFKKKHKNAQNQRAKLIFWKWVKLFLYNFGLFQQVFENLKLNKLVKEERRLDLEDRIQRLKFGKSAVLKLHFEEWIWKLALLKG